jgi:hypothetical protein
MARFCRATTQRKNVATAKDNVIFWQLSFESAKATIALAPVSNRKIESVLILVRDWIGVNDSSLFGCPEAKVD